MNTINNADNAAINDVINSFARAYAGRDKNINFSDWFLGQLQNEMPDLSTEAAGELSNEINKSVSEYDNTLADLNSAIEDGQSKESWLADKLVDACEGMPGDEAGSRLKSIYKDLNTANGGIVEIEDEIDEEVITAEGEVVEYNLKNKALAVGAQASMAGLNVALGIVTSSIESGEQVDVENVIGQALGESIKTAKSEVKAIVAGSIKTATVRGLSNLLPEDISNETISDVACVAVETAEALIDTAMGNSTMLEASDRIERASVAVISRLGVKFIKGAINCIPYIGPVIVKYAGRLIDYVVGEKITELVKKAVPYLRNAIVSVKEKIKQTGNRFFNWVKSKVFS